MPYQSVPCPEHMGSGSSVPVRVLEPTSGYQLTLTVFMFAEEVTQQDPSHVGMGGSRLPMQEAKPKAKQKAASLQSMTLAEQERMALSLLGRQSK